MAILIAAVALITALTSSSAPVAAEIRIFEGDECPDVIAPVAYLYQAFFLREPDPQGLDFWVQFVTSDDGSLSAAAALFATSPEYLERYGDMTNQEFVRALYPNVFGRPPDADGLSFWVGDLDQGNRTRSEVILVWSISQEFVGEEQATSPLIYDLRRAEYWCGSGATEIEVERLPLSVAQSIVIGPRDDHGSLSAEIQGLAENGTTVLSTGGLLSRTEGGVNLYIHPTIGEAVASYRIRIHGEGEWILSSEWQPPPWRTY